MKLTETQIAELYKFTRKHYVYHYDVQTELVDHLANDIESLWQETPNVSLEKARDKTFKKFGVFGFMDVIDAKQKQMSKRYRKIMWRFFSEWFTMPKLLTTGAIFSIIYLFLKIPYSEYILLGSLFILVVYDLIFQYNNRKKEQRKEKSKEKIFLLEAMIGDTRNCFTVYTFINSLNFINITEVSFSSLEMHWLLLISFSTTLIIILLYVTRYLIPQKAEELLIETYPEYKLANNL
jgi:hypothetical protein